MLDSAVEWSVTSMRGSCDDIEYSVVGTGIIGATCVGGGGGGGGGWGDDEATSTIGDGGGLLGRGGR